MSIHICKCVHNGIEEYHLRYPGMSNEGAQRLADKINAGWMDNRVVISAIRQARREAFEEAAKVFETMQATAWPDEIAAAIRARGEGRGE